MALWGNNDNVDSTGTIVSVNYDTGEVIGSGTTFGDATVGSAKTGDVIRFGYRDADPASTAISKAAQKSQYKRLVQESVKIAAEKGKKKVYFPTGETVSIIEGWSGALLEETRKNMMRPYDNLNKEIKKGLGVKANKVNISGSTWWEVDIPESYLSGTQEIIAFGLGGKMRVKKRQQ